MAAGGAGAVRPAREATEAFTPATVGALKLAVMEASDSTDRRRPIDETTLPRTSRLTFLRGD